MVEREFSFRHLRYAKLLQFQPDARARVHLAPLACASGRCFCRMDWGVDFCNIFYWKRGASLNTQQKYSS